MSKESNWFEGLNKLVQIPGYQCAEDGGRIIGMGFGASLLTDKPFDLKELIELAVEHQCEKHGQTRKDAASFIYFGIFAGLIRVFTEEFSELEIVLGRAAWLRAPELFREFDAACNMAADLATAHPIIQRMIADQLGLDLNDSGKFVEVFEPAKTQVVEVPIQFTNLED